MGFGNAPPTAGNAPVPKEITTQPEKYAPNVRLSDYLRSSVEDRRRGERSGAANGAVQRR